VAASLQRRKVTGVLAGQIEGVRALRRQPASSSVKARRHLDFRIVSAEEWPSRSGGCSRLLAIDFFITKTFHFQQLAADIGDFSIAVDAVLRRRAACPTFSIAREFFSIRSTPWN
jgi:hypothetical protein